MGMLTILFGEQKKPTFKEVQKKVMKFARENDMGDMEASRMLRSELKKFDIPLPKDMATEKQFKKQQQDKPRKTKKAEMAYGGMANGKKHMYLNNGGSVKDLNPGLQALNKVRPDVVKKILKKS
tara:strand:+ start:278 stop:649 length:372 start_codon:yes stop_codon:yes gene_type:complete